MSVGLQLNPESVVEEGKTHGSTRPASGSVGMTVLKQDVVYESVRPKSRQGRVTTTESKSSQEHAHTKPLRGEGICQPFKATAAADLSQVVSAYTFRGGDAASSLLPGQAPATEGDRKHRGHGLVPEVSPNMVTSACSAVDELYVRPRLTPPRSSPEAPLSTKTPPTPAPRRRGGRQPAIPGSPASVLSEDHGSGDEKAPGFSGADDLQSSSVKQPNKTEHKYPTASSLSSSDEESGSIARGSSSGQKSTPSLYAVLTTSRAWTWIRLLWDMLVVSRLRGHSTVELTRDQTQGIHFTDRSLQPSLRPQRLQKQPSKHYQYHGGSGRPPSTVLPRVDTNRPEMTNRLSANVQVTVNQTKEPTVQPVLTVQRTLVRKTNAYEQRRSSWPQVPSRESNVTQPRPTPVKHPTVGPRSKSCRITAKP